MRRLSALSFVIACFVVGSLLTSCATTVHLKPNMVFRERSEKIQMPIGVYVSLSAKDFIAAGKNLGYTFRVSVGESIEPNARNSLAKIFTRVKVVNDAKELGVEGRPPNTLDLACDKSSQVHPGMFTFSPNEVVLGLVCKIYNQNGQKVWEKTIHTKAKKWSAWGLLGGIIGSYSYTSSLRRAGDEALRLALDQLNDAILRDRNTLFKEDPRQ